MNLEELLIQAKLGHASAKEEIINRYYPLIIKEAKNVYLKEKTFEDLIQIGIVNILNAINKFDITKDANSFTSYVLWSIKNGFRYLCRKEIRYNDECSLNKQNSDGTEMGLCILDNINVEELVFNQILVERLKEALKQLDYEELEIIKFLYLSEKKQSLLKYSQNHKKDYYYCTCLKKRALIKLKKHINY